MDKKRAAIAGAIALVVVIAAVAFFLVFDDESGPNDADMTAALQNRAPEATIEHSAPAAPSLTGEGGAFDGRRINLRHESVPGEIVVAYKENARPAAIRAGVDAEVADPLRSIADAEVLEVDEAELGSTLEELRSDPQVLFAHPNYIASPRETRPNDPQFSQEWGLQNTGIPIWEVPGLAGADIDAPQAWDISTGSEEVVVAVVDTGVAFDHPDLATNMWENPGESGDKANNGADDDGNGYVDDVRGWDFVDGDNDPRDLHGHGTHVAGTIAAQGNDGQGITGVAWDARIMPVRVLGPYGSDSAIADGFAYAAANGASIVNASLGGYSPLPLTEMAVRGAPQTLFVVAAGNDALNVEGMTNTPCSIDAPNLICIAATNNNDNLADFSNYAANQVDMAAPGEGILSTFPNIDTLIDERFNQQPISFTGEGSAQWGTLPDPEHPGSSYITESPTGNYADNTDTWLRSNAAVPLSGRSDCRLDFLLELQLADRNDIFTVETSPDGNGWTELVNSASPTSGWVDASVSLETVTSDSYIRFRLRSDAAGNADGLKLDAVRIECVERGYDGSEYVGLDGTSMASPHVAGVAALLKATVPEATAEQMRDVLFQSGEAIPSLAGKTATGVRLNAHRALLQITGQL